jgi:UDP-glucose 4-epimerase
VGDGEQTRDYVHVKDVVAANILASQHPGTFTGDVFNVGCGKNYSVNWIANKIESDKTKITNIPARGGEARDTISNIEKIKSVFGWQPSISLDEWLK